MTQEGYRGLIGKIFDDVKESNTEDINDIWVPNFSLKGKSLNCYEGVCDTGIESSWVYFELGIKAKRKQETFKRTIKEDSKVIEGPFVFGLINTLLEEKSGLSMFSVLVNQQNFVKCTV